MSKPTKQDKGRSKVGVSKDNCVTVASQIQPVRRSRRKDVEKRTSLEIFREYILLLPDGTLDASPIISRDCYMAWLGTRRQVTKDPEKTFQRTLSSHLTAIDGRAPFTEKEEEAILQVLRQGNVWPCFSGCEVRFGCSGFRARGYHEKLRTQDEGSSENGSSCSGLVSKKLKPTAEVADLGTRDSENMPSSGLAFPLVPMMPQINQPGFNLFYTPQQSFFNFYSALNELFLRYSGYSWELWERGGLLVRLMVMGTGETHVPTLEDAHRMLEELKHRFPKGYALHVFNVTETNYENRFMLQDDLSRLCFGRITKADGGFKKPLIYWTSSWSALKSFELAFHNRGSAFLACYKMNFAGVDYPVERNVWNMCNKHGTLIGYAIELPPWISDTVSTSHMTNSKSRK